MAKAKRNWLKVAVKLQYTAHRYGFMGLIAHSHTPTHTPTHKRTFDMKVWFKLSAIFEIFSKWSKRTTTFSGANFFYDIHPKWNLKKWERSQDTSNLFKKSSLSSTVHKMREKSAIYSLYFTPSSIPQRCFCLFWRPGATFYNPNCYHQK